MKDRTPANTGPPAAGVVDWDLGAFLTHHFSAPQPEPDERPAPFMGAMLEMTPACNLHCTFCYIDFRDEERPRNTREEMLDWVDQIADLGCTWLTFTGGEAMLHRDFEDVYRRAVERGLVCSIFTNGTTILRRAELLHELPPRKVEVSVYGMCPETYEKVAGKSRWYQDMRAGVQWLRDNDIPTVLKMMIHKDSLPELEQFRAWADEMECAVLEGGTLHARRDGADVHASVRLEPEDYVRFEMREAEKNGAMDEKRAWHRERFPSPPSSRRYTCGGGSRGLYINGYAEVQLCSQDARGRYDLRTMELREIREERLPAQRSVPRAEGSPCSVCPYRRVCDNCPASAYVETGDPDAAVPWHCRTAIERVRVLLDEELPCPGLGDDWREGRAMQADVVPLPVVSQAPAGACGSGGCC